MRTAKRANAVSGEIKRNRNFTKQNVYVNISLSVADPEPGSGALLTPGSRIRDEYPGSYFRELRNNFLG